MRRFIVLGVVWFGLTVSSVGAEDPVHFPDDNLKAAIEAALGIVDPTPSDMLTLHYLDASYKDITDTTGLGYARNLQHLDLCHNRIWHLIADLSGLTNLQWLSINNNRISDISLVANFPLLEHLDIHDNAIGDLSPLAGLTHLRHAELYRQWDPGKGGVGVLTDISVLAGLKSLQVLYLGENSISDISALTGLTSLTELELMLCPLNETACMIHIPQIVANNPGIHIVHDACGNSSFTLTVSASAGGSILQSGLGTSSRSPGEVVWLWAQALPGFQFLRWSGTVNSPQNPFSVTMDQDYEIRAHFVSTLKTLVVDDNAPGDPKPQDPNSSDPAENGSPEHPFDRIQDAIDVAAQGASIVIRPGTYRENLDLLGKSISLIGMDPNDPNCPAYPVIAAANPGPVLRFASGEDPNCLVQGLVITQGQGWSPGAVYCRGASATISHCLIVGNRTSDPTGAAVCCIDSRAQLLHCTLADNVAGSQGGAVSVTGGQVVLSHCILWANTPTGIVTAGSPGLFVTYCDLQSPWPGAGNGCVDPLFAARGYWSDPTHPAIVLGPDRPEAVWVSGDYHLQSKAGRWDPQVRLWKQDNQTSPCIDAGLASAPAGYEPMPNGGRINLGAYGGTSQASKTWLP